MKKNLLIMAGLIALTALYTVITNRHAVIDRNAVPVTPPTIAAGHRVPDVSFTTVDGKTRRLSDYAGKVIILNFWASWCTPCVVEFPALLKLAAAFPDDVVLVALSADHDRAMMDRFLENLKRNNPQTASASNVIIGWDKDNTLIQPVFQTVRLPETILIGPDHIMRDKIAGAVEWDGPAMQEKIRGYISKNP